jgi:hypothetical protein
MNSFVVRFAMLIAVCLLLVAGSIGVVHSSFDNKLAPADLIAKHLDSIGPPDARARKRGMQIKGTFVLTAKQGGAGETQGQVMMASQGGQNSMTLAFDGDANMAFAYDGSKTTVTQFRPGRHTPIEQFFSEYNDLIKEGLFGGTLSESWALLSTQEKNPKVEYAGLKKIDGVQLHALKYALPKNPDVKITLFFDAETFRHVRTEYDRTIYSTDQQRIASGRGLPPATNERQAVQRLTARETFADFKPEGGLNLPHDYRFELSVQSQTRPMLVDWVFKLADFKFDVPLDARQFVIGSGNN